VYGQNIELTELLGEESQKWRLLSINISKDVVIVAIYKYKFGPLQQSKNK